MRVPGPSRQHLDQLGDDFAALVERGIDQAARVATKDLKLTWTGDDLAVIARVFNQYTTDTLVPELAKHYDQAVQSQADRVTQAALSVTAAIVLPTPPDVLAEQYLSTATNRLKGISDEVWQQTRTELTAGMQAGESIPQLRKRIMSAADVSKARATVIARTEVIGAQNRGSLGQMMATGYGGTKDWLATVDHQTRQSHANANGQTVKLAEKFSVGGTSMDGPHDPAAPPGETISCRCTLTYEIDPDELRSTALTGTEAYDSTPEPTLPFGFEDHLRYATEYQGGAYRNLNYDLRNGTGNGGEISRQLSNLIHWSDPLPEAIEVTRGMADVDLVMDSFKAGQIVTDKGFASTTAASDVASFFGESMAGGKPAVWVIRVPAGTKVLKMPNPKGEYEILLDKGTRFRILTVTERDGTVQVTAEVTP